MQAEFINGAYCEKSFNLLHFKRIGNFWHVLADKDGLDYGRVTEEDLINCLNICERKQKLEKLLR